MAVKYVKDFEHSADFGFTGSAGQPHVKPHVRSAPTRRKISAPAPKGGLDPSNLPLSMAPIIKPR